MGKYQKHVSPIELATRMQILFIMGEEETANLSVNTLESMLARRRLFGDENELSLLNGNGTVMTLRSQLRHVWAAAGHYCSPARLKRIRELYGGRIAVFASGSGDPLVNAQETKRLAACLEAELYEFPLAG